MNALCTAGSFLISFLPIIEWALIALGFGLCFYQSIFSSVNQDPTEALLIEQRQGKQGNWGHRSIQSSTLKKILLNYEHFL